MLSLAVCCLFEAQEGTCTALPIIALCSVEGLVVLRVSSSERRGCRAKMKMCTAVGIIRACTALNLVKVLDSPWPDANTLDSL